MSHPNTVAFTAGAIACPDGGSAQRHHARGDRATWIEPPQLQRGETRRTGNVEHRTSLLIHAQRRWTR